MVVGWLPLPLPSPPEASLRAASLAIPAFGARFLLGGEPPLLRALIASLTTALTLALFLEGGSWEGVGAVVLSQAASAGLTSREHRLPSALLLLSAGGALILARPSLLPPSPLLPSAAALVCGAALLAAVAIELRRAALRCDPWKLVVPTALLALGCSHLSQLVPIEEFALARRVGTEFVGAQFDELASRIAMTTIHTQCAPMQAQICASALRPLPLKPPCDCVGYLRSAQLRKNRLMEVAEGKLDARGFLRCVGGFLLTSAAPYMAQRTLFELLNEQAVLHFVNSVENSLRLGAATAGGGALGVVGSSNLTVEAHSDALRQVMLTTFRIFERKVFSLPKLLLFPGILYTHPMLSLVGLPLALSIDAAKAKVSAALTTRIEERRTASRALASKRARIEAHDTSNAGLIEAAQGTTFMSEHWSELTLALQAEERAREALVGLRNWVGWLYWQDVLQPGTECAVAFLLEYGHIGLADLWLYARVLEDGVDAILTRSRMEAQLARLHSDAAKLMQLRQALRDAQLSPRVSCRIPQQTIEKPHTPSSALVQVGCSYSRGHVRVDTGELSLTAGVFALAGPNGSGKSTLLALLSSCARGGVLPADILLHGGCTVLLPSPSIVEVTQRQWCPLHVAPIRWLAYGLPGDPLVHAETAASIAHELHFIGRQTNSSSVVSTLADQWVTEQEDYYSELSGGQRAKLELIRTVFLPARCPDLLLLDEVFAPLDPASKALIMRKIKLKCRHSTVLIVYHPDSADKTDVSPDNEGLSERLCDVGVDQFFDVCRLEKLAADLKTFREASLTAAVSLRIVNAISLAVDLWVCTKTPHIYVP
ncbi:MAG: hypothetical protein SGPRY_001913 [Prymnesium sp.]